MRQKTYITLGVLFLVLFQVNGQTTCEENITINNATVTNTLTVQANNTITTSGTNLITSNAIVDYRAGTDITLSPNFDIINGASFDAFLEGCDEMMYNDPYLNLQWGHYKTINSLNDFNGNPITTLGEGADIFGAWEITKGNPNIKVAILDYGLDMGHEDFNYSRIENGRNFTGGNINDYSDTTGHGTTVTGILGAFQNNNKGLSGVDWNCKIMPLKIIPEDFTLGDISYTINAIDHAIINQANIISLSSGDSPRQSLDLEIAYREAIDSNILILAAAGNDNRSGVDYPARYRSVVGVGALSPCDERKSSVNSNGSGSCDQDNRLDLGITNWGSNYGDGLDFLAPGTLLPSTDISGVSEGLSNFPSIYNSDNEGNYILNTYGTSMSTPFAAGIASLVWGVNPDLKNYQVRHIMQVTSRNMGTTLETGYGALNAKAAVEMAQKFNVNSYLLPNLTVELDSIPTVVNGGSNLIFTYRVKNTGDAPVNASIKLGYAINQSGINANLINRTDDVNINLAPQQSTILQSISIPILCEDRLHPGAYRISMEIDATNVVNESNEFNTYYRNFNINGAPDVKMENTVISNTGNNLYSISYTTKNIGNTRAYIVPPSLGFMHNFYKFYASDNPTYDENIDEEIDEEDIFLFELCPQSTYQVVVNNLSIDSSVNYLIIKADSDNLISESNENNNTIAIAVPPAPIKFSYKKTTSEIASTFNIQVVPNPIVDSSNIKYNLPNESMVNVSILNVFGREVLSVLKLSKQQKGNYNYYINNADLTTGLYFLEIVIDDTKHIKKLIVK